MKIIFGKKFRVVATQTTFAVFPTPQSKRVEIPRTQTHVQILDMHPRGTGAQIQLVRDLADAISLHQQICDVALPMSDREMPIRIVAPDDREITQH